MLFSKVLELCFQLQAPNKLTLGYWKAMMKAIRRESTERIYLIFPYIMHYSGIYFVWICTKKTMKEQMKNIQIKI